MDPLARELNQNGAEVFRVGLTGHRGDFEAMKTVTPEQWLHDLSSAYQLARQRADELGVPLNFIGYSLGALVNSALMSRFGSPVRYDRQVLLAPAIKVKFTSHLLKVLNIFGKGFRVPSLNDAAHRANKGTAMAAYNALFELVSDFKQANYRGMNIPTLVLGDPEDELVDFAGLKAEAKLAGLNFWKFESLDKRDVEKIQYHHLITDPGVLGPETWANMMKKITTHLEL